VDKAIKLSPLDPDLGRFYWIMGRAYFTQGKYDKAIENLQQSIQLTVSVHADGTDRKFPARAARSVMTRSTA
jgi:tetratricopeptide (TPR) repeat protein